MTRVEIQIRGHLDRTWSQHFGGLSINYISDGTTTLTGNIQDQPAFYGLLVKLGNLNLDLLSVITGPTALTQRKGGSGP